MPLCLSDANGSLLLYGSLMEMNGSSLKYPFFASVAPLSTKALMPAEVAANGRVAHLRQGAICAHSPTRNEAREECDLESCLADCRRHRDEARGATRGVGLRLGMRPAAKRAGLPAAHRSPPDDLYAFPTSSQRGDASVCPASPPEAGAHAGVCVPSKHAFLSTLPVALRLDVLMATRSRHPRRECHGRTEHSLYPTGSACWGGRVRGQAATRRLRSAIPIARGCRICFGSAEFARSTI